MRLPADRHAEGPAGCRPQQAAHQVGTVGWREPGQKTHGQVSQQGKEGVSWRVGHLKRERQKKSGIQKLRSIYDGLSSLWVGLSVCVPHAVTLQKRQTLPVVTAETLRRHGFISHFPSLFLLLFLWPLPKDGAPPWRRRRDTWCSPATEPQTTSELQRFSPGGSQQSRQLAAKSPAPR